MKISALNRKLHRAFGGRVTAALADGCIVLRGELDRWDDVVRAGQMAATKYSTCHVVNDITFTGGEDAPMAGDQLPGLVDQHRHRPAPFADGGGDLRHLCLAVDARIAGVGQQRRHRAPLDRIGRPGSLHTKALFFRRE